MPLLNLPLDEIRGAREALQRERDAQRVASASLAQARAALDALRRDGAGEQALAAQRGRIAGLAAQVREGAAGARERIAALRGLSDRLLLQRNPAQLVQALSADRPVLLMPVAVQTRYAEDGSALLIRVYPDTLHAFAHEPGLAPGEVDAGKLYWRARFAIPDDAVSPWTEIARRYRPARAAWIVRRTTPTNLAQLGQAQAEPAFDDAAIALADPNAQLVYATALPDRFVAIGLRGDREIFRVWGSAVPELLPLSPAFDPEQIADAPPPEHPEDYDPFGADLAWMVDFETALGLGMGLVVTPNDLRNGARLSDGVERLFVLGVDWTQTPDSAAELIAELLDNHQHGAGLAFVAQGTPSNNTSGARAGFAANGADVAPALQPEVAAVRAAGVAGNGLAMAGARLQSLLGLRSELFDAGLIAGADLAESATAGHMANALWKATLGYTLRYFWNPIDSAQSLIDDDTIDELRAWCVRFLRAGGPLSCLRVGKQPYGLLPVTARGYVAQPNAPLERELHHAIGWFRAFWDAAQASVPTLADPSAESLHQVLAMRPLAAAKRFWQVAGPNVTVNDPGVDAFANWQRFFNAIAIESLLSDQPPFAKVPFIAGCLVRPKPHSLDAVPWVQRDPDNPTQERSGGSRLAPDYLASLYALMTTPSADPRAPLLAMQNGEALLEAMLGFAADEEVLHSGQQLFYGHLARNPNVSLDAKLRARRIRPAEYVGVDRVSLVGDQFQVGHADAVLGLKLLGTTGDLSVKEAIGARLSAVGASLPEHMKNIATFNDSLAWLKERRVGELDLALRGTLDLYSHRLDAWITSLATRRLERMREGVPTGLHIGAFGYVEKLLPDARQQGDAAADSLGYVHAPSLRQATTAAILRSGHVANRESAGSAFAIDLRSRRVKRAKRLLEGIANGQSMAALIGYRFERALRDAKLSQHILDFRKAYPLRPAGETYADQAQEAISARDATDGVRLVDTYRQAGLNVGAIAPPTVPAGDYAAIKTLLDDLLDQLDAVADLLLAESVFRMAGGNMDAAAAAIDALDKQERAPETRVVETPHSIRGYTQRVVVALQSSDAPAWPVDLAAQLEPRLNAWLARLLGDPARYAFFARVLQKSDAGWDDAQQTLDIGLAELGLSPLALVLQSEAQQGAGQSGVQEQLATALGAKARARFGADADRLALVLQAEASPNAPAGSIGLVAFESFAWLLRRLLEKSRALRRMDLVRAEDGIETEALLADGEFAGCDLADLKARLAVAEARAQVVLTALNEALPPLDTDVSHLDPNAPASQAQFDAVQGALAQAYALGWRGALASNAVAQTDSPVEGERVRPDDSLVLAVGRARALCNEVSGRLAAAPAPSDLDKDGKPVPLATQAQAALARIAAIMGRDFPLLPRFTLGAYAASASASLADRDELLANDDFAIDGWLPKIGCMREATGRLGDVLSAADALSHASAAGDFKLLQYPRAEDGKLARWGALPPAPAQVLRGVVAVAAHAPDALGAIAADDAIAGLFIDEWSESIPDVEETTGMGFHFDAPGARPPQAVLLAVPADPAADAWTLDALLATAQEAIALARLRAVRPQDLQGLGLILPGIFLSNNYRRDVPSVDFGALLGKSLARLRAAAGIAASSAATLAAGKAVVSD